MVRVLTPSIRQLAPESLHQSIEYIKNKFVITDAQRILCFVAAVGHSYPTRTPGLAELGE